MPKRLTTFDDSWLTDARFSRWIAKSSVSKSEAYCNLCKRTFSVGNGGLYQVEQHREGVKHATLEKESASQPKFGSTGGVMYMQTSNLVKVLSQEDQIAKAEILFLLRLIKHDHSFASCDDLSVVLRAAFNDPVSNGLTLSATKASYGISHGIAPYFHSTIIADMTSSWYSLVVDETTTRQNLKQFDIHVRFWSQTQQQIVRRYLTSSFLGHATADDLKSSIVKALAKDDLPLQKFLHLGADGPNVNKSLKKQLNDEVVALGGKRLVDIGSCNLHIVHNSFHAGLSVVNGRWSVDDLLNDVFQFFKKFPSRSADFGKIQEALQAEKLAFKRYVSNRWLSIGPVSARIIANWDCMLKYFLKTDHSKAIKDSSMYKRICTKLTEGDIMLARLHFIHSIAELFAPFLTKLQSESTLIHVLYDELAQLLRLLLQRFVKAETIKNKSDTQLTAIDALSSCRQVEECEFGAETMKLLRKLRREKNQHLALLQKDMQAFLRAVAKYLQERLPLDNVFLLNVRCLQPTQRASGTSSQMVAALCNCMPQISTGISFVDNVTTEWRLYEAESGIKSEWVNLPVDKYWSHVSQQVDSLGQPKYSNLMVVVKAALTVSHGQADVERGFSLNNHIIDDSRVSLKQQTVVAIRTVKDVVNQYGSVDKIPITRELIRKFKGAHAAYAEELAANEKAKQDQQAGAEETARIDAEKQTTEKRKAEIDQKHVQASKLIAEANERLAKASTSSKINMTDILAAQSLLQTGNTMLSESMRELQEIESLSQPTKKLKKQ